MTRRPSLLTLCAVSAASMALGAGSVYYGQQRAERLAEARLAQEATAYYTGLNRSIRAFEAKTALERKAAEAILREKQRMDGLWQPGEDVSIADTRR